MLRRIVFALAAAACLGQAAALLPEQFAAYRQNSGSLSTPAVSDAAVWDELGFEAAASAQYESPGRDFQLTAWRFKDPTGAFAAFQEMRPANSVSAGVAASLPGGGSLVLHKNYLLRFDSGKPHPSELDQLYSKLPRTLSTSLPPLASYLPQKGRLPNSERYILGPAGFTRFVPGIAPDLVSFHLGPEAAAARYRAAGDDIQLTIISYPTPQMAIAKMRAFEKLEGVVVRRTGPMIAIGSPASAAAQRLLSEVSYNPKLTWNEYVSKDTPQDAARMILAIFALAFFLIVASVAIGIMFGGFRVVRERLGFKPSADELTSLHLQ